jgi:hypothetical protein
MQAEACAIGESRQHEEWQDEIQFKMMAAPLRR